MNDRRALPGSLWQARLLGSLSLRHGDLVLDRFGSRQARQLLARLLLAPRRRWTRDELAAAIWPELCPDGRVSAAARGRLRRTLSTLRGLLEPPLAAEPFDADRDSLRLNAAAFDSDVERFERLVARRDWAAALDCWQGELLPQLQDPFVDAERERLAARHAWALAQAAADPAGAEDDEPAAPEAPRPVVPYRTRFFGRSAEIDRLCDALAAHRVVTVTGVGGCGKTRLVAEAAAEFGALDLPPVFVALADCGAAAQLLDHVRAALGIQPAGRPPIQQLAVRLADRRVLLILDNVEQLVDEGLGTVLSSLLERLPLARLLLTSRRRTGLAGERVIELAPLPLPAAEDTLAEALAAPSMALFADRARAARSDFHVGRQTAAAVAEVCRWLDGLPLALELAAAQIRRFPPREMLRELQAGQKLLARPALRAARAGRHASLEVALDWSWRLLQDPARQLLGLLTAFRGGFTVEQALAVGGGLADLHALADASLLQAGAGPGRFQMLGVVREFVEARLAGPQRARARARHRALFAGRAQAIDESHDWPAHADVPNFVQAAASACDDGDPACGARLLLSLGPHWRARGAPDAVAELLARVAPALDAAARVDLFALLCALHLNAGRAAQAHAEVVHALEAAGADGALLARAALAQAAVHWRAAHDDRRALELIEQAQRLLGGTAPAALQAQLLLLQSAIALESRQDPETAAAGFEKAERLFRAIGDRRMSLLALPGRAACLLVAGRMRQAAAMAAAGARAAAELGDVSTELQMLNRLASAHEGLGRYEEALAANRRELRLAHQHGLRYFVAFALWNQPMMLARLGRAEAAMRLMAHARAYWLRQSPTLTEADEAWLREVRQLCEAPLGKARCDTLWAEGERLDERAGLALAQGDEAGRAAPAR